MTVIYLVRHGQSQANARGIWQGAQIDTPLTELGRTQAQNTKKHREEEGAVFYAIYSSPLLRAGIVVMRHTHDPRIVSLYRLVAPKARRNATPAPAAGADRLRKGV